MTVSQGILFVVYFSIVQFILVAAAGLAIHRFLHRAVGLSGLASAFGLLAGCGPVYALLIWWFRSSSDVPKRFAIRFGLSMSVIVILYVMMLSLGAEWVGFPLLSLTALPGYFASVLIVGFPIFSLTAYALGRMGCPLNRT